MGLEGSPTGGSTRGSLGGTQQVILDGQASDPFPALSGVPQGLVLGPVPTVRMVLCKRNFHVDSYKIDGYFRTLSKFKLILMHHVFT